MKYLLMCAGLLFTVFQSWGQERLADRIAPPSGYVRETCPANSFTTYLRNLPMLPKGSKVLLYNGKEKANQAAAFAVVDMEIGNRDLQQCADAFWHKAICPPNRFISWSIQPAATFLPGMS
ncbi:DUF4846 domain-containing protein [Bacteroides sp. CR5/BHMF/2]|nr:DUF4846 domain-containing protein [Bacteroides sp. CR5/BHMF/2]